MAAPRILISAGESSGDLYAARLVDALRRRLPGVEFFGCAGTRMQQAGVRAVVDARSLAVVGLVEVISHLPRIWGEFRKLKEAARRERPDLAILTDSPDFHLRLARPLRAMGIPVVYLVAPQVWAWRRGRLAAMRRLIGHLLCIFPFEEEFFRTAGMRATYIGHPLAGVIAPRLSRDEFFRKHRLPAGRPLVVLLPGSRVGEIGRHLKGIVEAAEKIYQKQAVSFVWAAPAGLDLDTFRERIRGSPIQVIEGETWDALAHADLALAASGTVTMEAALLGTPMVTYYRVATLSWMLGRRLVRAPYLSMVNLVAGRKIVPELMQNEMRGERLAAEALRLLADDDARRSMRRDLAEVARRVTTQGDAMEAAASIVVDELTRRK